MQVSSIPACNSYQYHEKKCERDTAAAPLMQVNSIPACTSYECQKRDASQVIDHGAFSQMSSDPICHSAGCPEWKKDATKDYRVPNFGLDHDIITSQTNEKATEKKLGHQWVWSPEPTSEEIRDKALIRSLAQKQAISDPICSSAHYPDCFIGNKSDSEEKIVRYNVDHTYPLDSDIIVSQKNLKEQETSQKHVFQVPQKK